MRKNELIRTDESIYRILEVTEDMVLLMDCIKLSMPRWYSLSSITQYEACTETELMAKTGRILCNAEELDVQQLQIVRQRISMIADILPYIGDKADRSRLIEESALQNGVSKRTISNALCLYLAYQNPSVFVLKNKIQTDELSRDEKNFRWALNKFFYSREKHSLQSAYTIMLKEKYCDNSGVLLGSYPTFHQFRYFYRKHHSLQKQYISRDGLKHYQRNHRPLLGDGVGEFAPHIGVGLLDATVCDIYLVDDSGKLVGRPILTACVDAYSGLCCGYSLTWEGGVYSLRGLMLNVIADKTEHCRKHGILIEKSDWDCNALPSTLVTDKGSEYTSGNFEQIAECGVEILHLPAYRPELKGRVEKFFDLVQGYYKSQLKYKGVIEPDFQERGARDYRKDACLTMEQFERILLRCILYYNTKRVIENFPYTEDMLSAQVKPYASEIWNYDKANNGIRLIPVSAEKLILTLLPRTTGKFGRNGLRVNGIRYKHDGYTEQYLKGETAIAAYNPEDVSFVWLIENGVYIPFTLVENRFRGKKMEEVSEMLGKQKALVKASVPLSTQAKIDLANHIQAVADTASRSGDTDRKHIRQTRRREQRKTHRDYTKETMENE